MSNIDNLVEHSSHLFEIEYDNNLNIPAMSILMIDNNNIYRNKIILNYNLIKNLSINVIAHILAHEWGHHIYKHTHINPQTLNKSQKKYFEIEADIYACNFIKKYKYNINDIIEYIENDKKKNYDLFYENNLFIIHRLNILNNN